ncbi:NAD(P)H-hydrate dehydratase [Thalassotalea ponticola]|uniref:NAD(P)H-hydrate dehydratase n=1 Tax=Thalassotalea ponticola TaxID=1523392 RepID=UPI0025B5BB6E|nr:NAD(P)H-hydrate dehydratase [Thalassotalea ponticola]MDN3652878.1 NAD(P)H-hydrate dehydratase [Thalassotalea ponticola]
MLPVKLDSSIPEFAYRADTVRKNEPVVAKQQGVSMYALMQAAGQSSFNLMRHLWSDASTVLVVCGSGNNAGDGFVLATQALKQGMAVYVHSVCAINDYCGDAARACQHFLAAGGMLSKICDVDFQRVDVVIDALLGTGITGTVREHYQYLIKLVNQLPIPILSLDIPSGLNADSGQVMGICVRASATVTFIALKQGLLTGQSKNYCGDMYFAGLRMERAFGLLVPPDVKVIGAGNTALVSRALASHKGDSGTVLVVGGNKGMSGAVRLAATAAYRSGAGLVMIDCHPSVSSVVASSIAEAILVDVTHNDEATRKLLAKVNSICLGPGLGRDVYANARMNLLAFDTPVVVDADALSLLANKPISRDNWVLTPHPKEAATLLSCDVGDVQADRVASAKAIAVKYNAICVLKGAGSVITDGQQVAINTSGNPGMAVAGMGDVLAGIISALSLQSTSLFDAVCCAVYLHGRAADMAAVDGVKGMLPSDLMVYIRQLVNQY